MRIQHQIVLCILMLLLVVCIFDYTAIDVWLQNHFYSASATQQAPLERWLIYKGNKSLDFWFHKSIKTAIIAFGAITLLLGLASFYFIQLAPYRHRLLFLCIAMAMVPLLVGGAKHFTNTYCPNQTTLYGGDKPYVKLLESYPTGFTSLKKGRCFPAGHATAGFSLMAVYFVLKSRKARLLGLFSGLTLGWLLGIFQMLRGEHFLSHTVFTMIASWLVILLVYVVYQKITNTRELTQSV